MKIVFLIPDPTLPPRIYKEAQTLRQAGYEIQVIGWSRNNTHLDCEEIEGILVERIQHRAPTASFQLLLHLPVFYIKVARSLWRKDFSILHCCRFDMLIVGLIIGKLKRSVVIYDAYEYYPMMVRNYFSGVVQKIAVWGVTKIEDTLARLVDMIFTVDTEGDILLKRFQNVNKHTIVLQNVPVRSVCEEDPDLVSRFAHHPVLFYAGGLTRSKGIAEMIEVLHLVSLQHPNVKLLIAGKFPHASFEDEMHSYISRHKLEKNVEFLGFLPYERVRQYARVATLGLELYHPNPYYSISRGSSKLFMYMEAALPIIVSNLPGIGGLVAETGSGILVDPFQPSEVAQTVLQLLNNPEERKRLGNNGHRAFEEIYNWQVEEEKFLEAYKMARVR